MKTQITTLSILSIVAAGLACAQPANAANAANSARFDYAPNVFKMENPNTPRTSKYYSGPISNVRSGAVPHGSNFLGVDPQLLAKPAPPPPSAPPAPIARIQQMVSARPVIAQATPKIIPQMPAAFKAAFGQPITPPVIAQAATPAQPLADRPMTASKPTAHSSATRDVSGKLLTHRRAVGRSAGTAHALPQTPIASYGGMGYQPGAFIPTASGSGSHSSSSVIGRIIRH